MQKHLMQLVQKQEEAEKLVYRSPAAIRTMIQGDFLNSAEILCALDGLHMQLPELFRMDSLSLFADKAPIPIRTCDAFCMNKHTFYQIPYLHSHDYYELVYVLQGECVQHFLSPCRSLHLKAHEACLLRPGTAHLMERCGQENIILKCSIPVTLYNNTAGSILSDVFATDVLMLDRCTVQMEWYLFMLAKECAERPAFFTDSVKCYLSLFFIEWIRKPADACPDIAFKLSGYFEDQAGHVDLHSFASRIGYSEDHVCRLLKKCTGKSCLDFILELKLSRAARLLRETDDSVAQIAQTLGYANTSGLYKQFYRAYGVSPGRYRNSSRGNVSDQETD